MQEQNKVTTEEILEAINSFANHTEQRFQKLEERDAKMEKDIAKLQATVVTKDYFDEKLAEKLADLRGDIVVLVRKEDHKLEALLKILSKKSVISDEDVNSVLAMEPFPRAVVN